MNFELLHDDPPCFVLNKPPGLATQAPAPFDSLEVRLKELLREREGKTGNIYLGVPHRLDRAASGAIVFARHERAARRIAGQFERREVLKVYWAIVAGRVEPEQGVWTDYLRKVYGHPRTEVVEADAPLARQAVLRYTVRARFEGHCALEIQLETGRTHQIRVQAACRGFPVLGDELYGSVETFGPWRAEPRERSIALHARRLAFRHPMRDEQLDVTAPTPSGWEAWEPRIAGFKSEGDSR